MQQALMLGGGAVRRAFRWWVDGLALLVPARLYEAWSAPAIKLIIRRNGSRWVLLRSDMFRNAAKIVVYAETEKPLAEAIKNQPYVVRRLAQIQLELDRADFLTFQRNIPESGRADLKTILNYELQRSTLLHPSDVYTGVRVSTAADVDGLLRVEQFVIPRGEVDPLREALSAIGHHVERTYASGEDGRARVHDLWLGSASHRREPMVYACAVAMFILFATTAYQVYDWHTDADQRIEQLQSQIRVARARVRSSTTERERRRTTFAHLTSARRARRSRHALPVVLAELSQRLPQSTWVHDLQYQIDSVVISGVSDAAATLVDPLAASDVFAAAEFVAPIVKDPATGKERFRLKISLSTLD